MYKRRYLPLAALTSVGTLAAVTPPAQAAAYWEGNVSNEASNHGGDEIRAGQLRYHNQYYTNNVDSQIAPITCGTSWNFIDGYTYIGARDGRDHVIGLRSGGGDQCWKVRVRTPNSGSSYYFSGRQSASVGL